jgi:hypothetical protein
MVAVRLHSLACCAYTPHLLNHASPPWYFDFRSPTTRRGPLSLRRLASPYPPSRKLRLKICLVAVEEEEDTEACLYA